MWGAMRTLGVSHLAAATVALAALCLVPAARADLLVIQPDGKLVLAGWTSSEAGALARLSPDGDLDPGFGRGGFVIEHRVPGFQALAVQANGGILGASAGGSPLARFLADGTPDPSFGIAGIGGTDEPGQPHEARDEYGPAAVLVRPDGSIVVAGNEDLKGGVSAAWVRRYDAAGGSEERIGYVRPPGGGVAAGDLADLMETGTGALIGAGSLYEWRLDRDGGRALLARFVPGSGTPFDPSFGNGAGLVQVESAGKTYRPPVFSAVTEDGAGRLLAAGGVSRTFLVARFDANGNLDPGFGSGGRASPVIAGPAASGDGAEYASSRATDLAVMPDGDLVLGGETTQWGRWTASKSLPHCNDCTQPLLVRLDPDGNLDPGFGDGGILRLRSPDGGDLQGGIAQVTALSDGKILVNGRLSEEFNQSWLWGHPFVARLNADGTYDAGFGDRGVRELEFPCSQRYDRAALLSAGCLPTAAVTLRTHRLRSPRPAVFVTARSAVPWASISSLKVQLPRGLLPARALRSKLRVWVNGARAAAAKLQVGRPRTKRGKAYLTIAGFGKATELRVALRGGGLAPLKPPRPRGQRVRFPMKLNFVRTSLGDQVGIEDVIRAAG